MIGASGFLGSRLLALAPRDTELTGTGFRRPVRPGRWRDVVCDATAPSQIAARIEQTRADAVLYTAYETTSRAVTVEGAANAARAAARAGAAFLFFSTDLIFDGLAGNYSETTPARPTLTYAQHKLEAEGLVKTEHATAVIVRPALMVGESGILLRPAYECGNLMRGQPVDLYADEWRSPVHVDDVARSAWELMSKDVGGTFHVGGPDRLSRLELGRLLCGMFRFDPALVREARRPADRPKDTSLNSTRAINLLGWAPRKLVPSRAAALAGV